MKTACCIMALALFQYALVSNLCACSGNPKSQPTKTDDKDYEIKKAQLIKEHLRIIRDKKLLEMNMEKALEAIGILEVFEATEAIPDLVEILDFTLIEKRTIFGESYPAAKALKSFGKPAADAIVKALAEKDRSPKYIRIALSTLTDLNGSRQKVKVLLNEEIKKEKDMKKIQRLKDVEATIKGS